MGIVLIRTGSYYLHACEALSEYGVVSGQNALKRAAIERILKERPELTDRAIAQRVEIEISAGAGAPGLATVNHKTVAAIRKELEQNGIIPHTTERIETDGRKARGRKPGNGEPT